MSGTCMDYGCVGAVFVINRRLGLTQDPIHQSDAERMLTTKIMENKKLKTTKGEVSDKHNGILHFKSIPKNSLNSTILNVRKRIWFMYLFFNVYNFILLAHCVQNRTAKPCYVSFSPVVN